MKTVEAMNYSGCSLRGKQAEQDLSSIDRGNAEQVHSMKSWGLKISGGSS